MALTLTGLTPLVEVFDMGESVRFYCGLLGFEVVAASPEVETPEGRFSHWMALRRGGAELMLNTAYDAGERPDVRDPQVWQGHRHVCFFIGCPDPDAAWAELTARGLAIEPPTVATYGMRQLFLRDPDGYLLCLQTEI